MVSARAKENSALRQESLTELYVRYWYPLFVYLRRKGYAATDAADYVQGFFAEMIHKDFLKAVEPQAGRFRWFLMSAIGRFVAKQIQAGAAKKRGGHLKTFSLDLDDAEKRYSMEPVDGWTAEKLFDRRWAIEVLQQALAALDASYRDGKRYSVFIELQPTLQADESMNKSYREIADKFEMTEAAIKVFAMRMRQAYREKLRSIIADTVADPDGIDDELEILFSALRG